MYTSDTLRPGDLVAIDDHGSDPLTDGYAYTFVRRIDHTTADARPTWFAVVHLVCFDPDAFEDAPWSQQSLFEIGDRPYAHTITKVERP